MTEDQIEQFAIERLSELGYAYQHGPGIAHDGEHPERASYEQVLLLERLREAVRRINPRIPAAAQEEAVKQVARIASPELLVNNEVFHRMLTEGVKVDYQQDGNTRGDLVWLVDFTNPANNDLLVVNQYTVVENGKNKRPDLLLFVNGLPLVLVELKNAADEKASIRSAYKQVETYKETIPGLFTYNAVVVISDGLEAKAGTVSSGYSRYMSWKTADGKLEASPLIGQLETLITGMLDPATLLDLVRHFIVFERGRKEDPKTGVTTITTVKKIAAYHQYYAVNRAVASTLRAAGFNSPPAEGWPQAGVVIPPAVRVPQSGVVNYADALPPIRLAAEGGEDQPALSGTPPGEGNLPPRLSGTPPGEGNAPPRLSGTPPGEVIYPKIPRNSKKFFDLPFNPALKERAKELRKARNLAEVVFWQQVHKKKFKGYDFDRQKIVGNYIVDFYCANVGVVIEIDGSSHDHKQEYDARRDEYLCSLGLTIIRIPATGVLKHLVQTMAWLEEHPAMQLDHPALSGTPPGEGNSPPRPSGTPPGEGNLLAESPESYGVPSVSKQATGDRKGGVVWHTQGSGKSLSMVFYTGKVVLAMDNPTIVVITDRNDLDDQLFDTFAASVQLLRQEPVQAANREHLKELLKVASGGVVFTTIQKFQPEEGNVYDQLSARENIVVIADEAHRTQYGFKARNVDVKDEAGEVVGNKIVYGFAKYLRDALPNATYLGFTGTPIESTDVSTPAVFGNYVDVYDIAQAVEDGATVRIFYESRLAKVNLSEEGKALIRDLDEELDKDDLTETQRVKAKWTQLEALIGSEDRIRTVARDIVTHFEQRQEVFQGKGMIVAMSRRIAAELYEAIVALRPEWHDDDLEKGRIKVVMTAASSDGPAIARHHTNKVQRRALAERMKDPDDPLQLVIVRDMWLTGFDAPSLHTMYIDKPMRGHNLMQAIARVNRVFRDKPGGLVVDYLGIAADLKRALSFYSDAGGKGDPTEAQEQAVALMLEKLEVVSALFHGFAYEEYFSADTARKLSLILAAEEHILGLEDGKKRYINEVTALSKAFAIAVPHDQAMDVKDEVGFFQAVKARLVKFDATGTGRTDEELETTIRQVIDQALVSEKVIDIYDAAGIKKPDISVLSEEFLMELKGMQHKNVAIEVLKKLLNDEIKARAQTNLVQSRSLMEMLETSIQRYHNKILTAAEVIEELISVGKEIRESDKQAADLGLTDYEYAFYTAVADNKSARELMQKDKLRELAVVLTERVRQNASIDWTIKESVRAKLKVIVKRTLRTYGYPPDMQKLATDLVLKQAEMLAGEFNAD